MKKLLAFACTLTFLAGFVSCGPSEEERKADSADVAKQAVNMNTEADSIIAAMNAQNDSAEAANKKADSMKKADSAKAKK